MVTTAPLLLSIKSEILDDVLDSMKETMDTLCDYAVRQYKRKFGSIEYYERKWIKLHTEREFFSAFEKYTKPEDTLIDFNKRGTINDVISLNCVINRNGENHVFTTHIIWKDLREKNVYFNFITKTSLPKTNGNSMSKSYNKKIKKISDTKELEARIHFTEVNINRIRCNILLSEMKSESEILRAQKDEWHHIRSLDWWDAIREGYDVTYEDEKEFNRIKEKSVDYALKKFREYNITKPGEKVRELKVELDSLKSKLKVMKNEAIFI